VHQPENIDFMQILPHVSAAEVRIPFKQRQLVRIQITEIQNYMRFQETGLKQKNNLAMHAKLPAHHFKRCRVLIRGITLCH
jgi:hypothetical protein